MEDPLIYFLSLMQNEAPSRSKFPRKQFLAWEMLDCRNVSRKAARLGHTLFRLFKADRQSFGNIILSAALEHVNISFRASMKHFPPQHLLC